MLKIAFDSIFCHPLPEGHRFPMAKYELLPQQLLYEGTVDESNFFAPEQIEENFVLTTHTADYFQRLKSLELTKREQRVSGFPHSAALIERELRIMEGTRKCAEFALENRVSMNIAGGTHHAFTDRGEGFCLLNDQAIASNFLLHSNLAKRILIVDLDVHQGNGTAEIFRKSHQVFTFSMHGRNNYPLKKEVSSLDVELEDGTGDKVYMHKLEENLYQVFEDFAPDFMFYQCGVDVLSTDKLGRLSLSMEGCKKRDEIVLKMACENNVPLVCSMGGGYSKEIKYIVEAHANTFRLAQDIFF